MAAVSFHGVRAGVCNVWGGTVTRFAWGRIAVVAALSRCEFDRAYVERLTAGHPDTEQHFTKYFGDLLTLKLRSRLRSPALIEDAKQETFVRVLIALRQGKGLATPESLGAFVNGVCNNVLFEVYRAQSRAIPLQDEHEPPDERPGSAEHNLLAGEQRGRVREAMRRLPEKEQNLLRWLFFEERSKDEVCRLLNVDRDYLRVLLHRAKNRFRECLNDVAN
jgi:RNA polymerase sigma-70 factor, ECF subfamily